ncbi:hypothetical protein GF354_03460 [Candidatus Peregrinibacteria bacterium]|nr:hypothetical protein [Candidatus Peregrinibacteria bacterium]
MKISGENKMDKTFASTAGTALLFVMIVSVVMTLTGYIEGPMGDIIITGSSLIAALAAIIHIRRKKKNQ